MRIKEQLKFYTTISAIGIVVITSLAVGSFSFYIAQQAMENQVNNHLSTLRDLKKEQVQQYFSTVKQQILSYSDDEILVEAFDKFKQGFKGYLSGLNQFDIKYYKKVAIENYFEQFNNEFEKKNGKSEPLDLSNIVNLLDENSFALQYNYIFSNPYDSNNKSKLNFVEDQSDYSLIHKKYHPQLKEFIEKFDIYDMLLVETENHNVIYSVAKEIDFTSSLLKGPFSKTSLGQVYRSALDSPINQFVVFSDYKPYLPSYNEQCAFVATPIFKQGIKVGVLIFQLPISAVNKLMTQDSNWQGRGLGRTGQNYLVGQDLTLRTENRFYIENEQDYFDSIKSLFPTNIQELIKLKNSTIGLQPSINAGSQKALMGQSGFETFKDYRNVSVLTAYAPLDIPNLNWAIISAQDAKEAYTLIYWLGENLIFYSIALSTLIACIALQASKAWAKTISAPIEHLSLAIFNLASGNDLTQRLTLNLDGELADIEKAVNNLITNFQLLGRASIKSQNQLKSTMDNINSLAEYLSKEPPINQTLQYDRMQIEQEAQMKKVLAATKDLNKFSNRLSELSEQYKFLDEGAEAQDDW